MYSERSVGSLFQAFSVVEIPHEKQPQKNKMWTMRESERTPVHKHYKRPFHPLIDGPPTETRNMTASLWFSVVNL